MKSLAILIFYALLLSPLSHQDELQAIEATYEGHSGGYYYFVDMEGSSYAFRDMEPEAREKYDLTDRSCEGRRFMVIYRNVYKVAQDKEEEEENGIVDDEEEGDDEYDYGYGECIIVDLEIAG